MAKENERKTVMERTIMEGQEYANTTSRLRPRKKIKKSKKDKINRDKN